MKNKSKINKDKIKKKRNNKEKRDEIILRLK
jgi:hypothetical protein